MTVKEFIAAVDEKREDCFPNCTWCLIDVLWNLDTDLGTESPDLNSQVKDINKGVGELSSFIDVLRKEQEDV